MTNTDNQFRVVVNQSRLVGCTHGFRHRPTEPLRTDGVDRTRENQDCMVVIAKLIRCEHIRKVL